MFLPGHPPAERLEPAHQAPTGGPFNCATPQNKTDQGSARNAWSASADLSAVEGGA